MLFFCAHNIYFIVLGFLNLTQPRLMIVLSLKHTQTSSTLRGTEPTKPLSPSNDPTIVKSDTRLNEEIQGNITIRALF